MPSPGWVIGSNSYTDDDAIKAAIDELNSYESLTLTAGTSQLTINRQRCFVSGRRVVISFDATATANLTSATDIALLKIPSGYEPSTDISGLGWVTSSADGTTYIGFAKVFKLGESYYAGQSAYGTIANGTRISVYIEYFI